MLFKVVVVINVAVVAVAVVAVVAVVVVFDRHIFLHSELFRQTLKNMETNIDNSGI